MNQALAKMFPDWPQWQLFWTTLEFGRESRGVWLFGFVVLFLLATWLARRDTRSLHPAWRLWLWSLRIAVLLALLVIALAPQERKSQIEPENSRVLLLVDTSVSMSRLDRDSEKDEVSSPTSPIPSRAEQVRDLLEKSSLLANLRKTHNVSIDTFDSQTARQQQLRKIETARGISAGGAARPKTSTVGTADLPIDWVELLRPRGAETRLGEALLGAIREQSGETLSGIVVISDGGNNAGLDPASVGELAVANKIRVITVGVGSTKKPVTLQLAEIQAPTHVHINDGFSIDAFVAGQGMARQPIVVDLLGKADGDDGEPVLIASREEQLIEDGVPVKVSFDYVPSDAGRRIFRVRVRPVNKILGLADEKIQDEVAIEVIDRKTKVLLVAGGPMRDYQLVRNLLHRDKTIDVDVLLQTGVPGISQESDKVLFQFPETREELFEYDAIVAFDPDWRKIRGETGKTLDNLSEWVFAQAGGLMLVAAEVNTTALATANDAVKQEMSKLLELYPVILDSHRPVEDDEFQQPWPLDFTRDGLEAPFLQVTENAATSAAAWKEFPGIYWCYPTTGAKAGATVYARFTDPRSGAREQPIVAASQYFGAGRVLYLGSGEMWRLRSLEEDYYDRVWIKMLREIGQGRLLRGTNRGVLLLEKTQYPLGSTVQVRTRLLDPQFKEYLADKVSMEVFDSNGKPMNPPLTLLAEKTRPGHYAGAFMAALPGTYQLLLPIPDSKDQLKGSISVRLPNVEFDHPEQNERLLRSIARKETGGGYLRLENAAADLPEMLPDRSTEKVVYEKPIDLWDRGWVMYLLVGLLAVEWLTRKLLKLA